MLITACVLYGVGALGMFCLVFQIGLKEKGDWWSGASLAVLWPVYAACMVFVTVMDVVTDWWVKDREPDRPTGEPR